MCVISVKAVLGSDTKPSELKRCSCNETNIAGLISVYFVTVIIMTLRSLWMPPCGC